MVWRRLRALLPILSWYRILPRVPIQPDGPESGFWVETKPSQVFTVAATPALLALDRFKRRSCRERLGDVRDLALDRQARCRTRAAKIGGLIQTRSFILPFRWRMCARDSLEREERSDRCGDGPLSAVRVAKHRFFSDPSSAIQ